MVVHTLISELRRQRQAALWIPGLLGLKLTSENPHKHNKSWACWLTLSLPSTWGYRCVPPRPTEGICMCVYTHVLIVYYSVEILVCPSRGLYLSLPDVYFYTRFSLTSTTLSTMACSLFGLSANRCCPVSKTQVID